MKTEWCGDPPEPQNPVRTLKVCLKAARNLASSIGEERGPVLRAHIDQALHVIDTEVPS